MGGGSHRQLAARERGEAPVGPRPAAPGRGAALLAAALLGLVACGSPAPRPIDPRRDLRDPDPGRRTQAVSVASRTGDTSRVPVLIEMLDDDDPAVRLAAAQALATLTGRRTGYRPWDGPVERRAAVEEWRAWFAAEGRPAAPGAATPAVRPVPVGPPTGTPR